MRRRQQFIPAIVVLILVGGAVAVAHTSHSRPDPAHALDRLRPSASTLRLSRAFPIFSGQRALDEVLFMHRQKANTPKRGGDSPALFVTWLDKGNPRRAYSILIYANGYIRTQRNLYNYAIQGGGMITQDHQGLRDLIARLPSLPEGLGDPPPLERVLIVSTDVGGTWRSRVYDRAALPTELHDALARTKQLRLEISEPGPELPPSR